MKYVTTPGVVSLMQFVPPGKHSADHVSMTGDLLTEMMVAFYGAREIDMRSLQAGDLSGYTSGKATYHSDA